MGLKNLVLKQDAESIAITGGTAHTFGETGQVLPGGVIVVDLTVADIRFRPVLTARTRPATYDKRTGKYSKTKQILSYVEPISTNSGDMAFNTLRIEREVHPDTSVTATDDFLKKGCQMLKGDDFAAFWATGSPA